jgi:release factor glutamine methyltransferase
VNIQQTLRKYISNDKISPLDAEILLSYALRKSREYLLAHPEKELAKKQETEIKKLMRRRYAGEPIAYLTSSKEFFGLDFYVDENTLIPRPETEILVEQILNHIQNKKHGLSNTNIVDVGTGSGNIIISIAKNIPRNISRKFSFYGIDISGNALRVAKKNAKKHRVDRKIKFAKSNILEYFIKNKKIIENKNLIITANLPYISPALYKKHLTGLLYEPRKALISKNKGLWHYEKLLCEIKRSFVTHQCPLFIALEISPEQKKPILRLIINKLTGAKVCFHKDLAGKDRLAEISFACIRD